MGLHCTSVVAYVFEYRCHCPVKVLLVFLPQMLVRTTEFRQCVEEHHWSAQLLGRQGAGQFDHTQFAVVHTYPMNDVSEGSLRCDLARDCIKLNANLEWTHIVLYWEVYFADSVRQLASW